MTYGNFYVGKGGFQYKKQGAVGNRKNPPYGLINGIYANVNNKYVPGAGVGASSIATRRAKLIRSTVCTSQYPCNVAYSRLGLQMSGGSNKYALNWGLPIVPNPPPPMLLSPSPAPSPFSF